MTFLSPSDADRDDRNHADVEADRHWLDDATLLDEHGDEILQRQIDADDAQEAKNFFRNQTVRRRWRL